MTMRLIAGQGFSRQKHGSHLLCGNVECRVPLERPYDFIDLTARLPGEPEVTSFKVAVCAECCAKVPAGTKVDLDTTTRYGDV